MKTKINRQKSGNKYQTSIIYLVMIPTILICLGSFYMISKIYIDLTQLLLTDKPILNEDILMKWMFYLWSFLFLFFVTIYFTTKTISNRLVGPMGRIIQEMHEMNESGQRKPLVCRKKDHLCIELINEINKLIEK